MKLRNLILLGLIVSVFGCGKDDLSEKILGEWIVESYVLDCENGMRGTLLGDENGCVTSPDDDTICYKFNFLADGITTLDAQEDGMGEGTYTVNDDTNELTFCFDDCITVIINNDKFVLSLDEDGCKEDLNFIKVN